MTVEEDVQEFGELAWVHCAAHGRPHTTGWCSVPVWQKTLLASRTYPAAVAECLARELWCSGLGSRVHRGDRTFHTFDGDRWSEHDTLQDATEAARSAIEGLRAVCDPEWSDTVEGVAVYEAPRGCEAPDEDGVQLYRSRMIDSRDGEDGEGVDIWCDYDLESAFNATQYLK